MADAASRSMERYLDDLRRALRGLPAEEARDIVEEIRSHIRDSASGAEGTSEESVGRALERLGGPGELAGMYRVDRMARRAVAGRAPWLALRTIARWAGLSVKGIGVLLASLAGYGLGGAFLVCALVKPFNPARVGLWRTMSPDPEWSLHLGFGGPPAGTEILGGWIVPLGLILGGGLLFVTYHFGLRSLDRFRRSLPMPGR